MLLTGLDCEVDNLILCFSDKITPDRQAKKRKQERGKTNSICDLEEFTLDLLPSTQASRHRFKLRHDSFLVSLLAS